MRTRPIPSRPSFLRLALALVGAVAPAACGGEGPDTAPTAGTDRDTAGGPGTSSPDDPPPATDPAAAVPGLELTTILERVDERNAAGELLVLDDMFPPIEPSVEAVQNRHDPSVTDTVRTLHYGGLDVEVYHVSSTGREMVRSITVDEKEYDTGLGFRVGDTRAEALEAMGEPDRRGDGSLSWDVYDGENDPTPTEIEARFGDDDRVDVITWSYYVD